MPKPAPTRYRTMNRALRSLPLLKLIEQREHCPANCELPPPTSLQASGMAAVLAARQRQILGVCSISRTVCARRDKVTLLLWAQTRHRRGHSILEIEFTDRGQNVISLRLRQWPLAEIASGQKRSFLPVTETYGFWQFRATCAVDAIRYRSR
jgi:hypothetical protein